MTCVIGERTCEVACRWFWVSYRCTKTTGSLVDMSVKNKPSDYNRFTKREIIFMTDEQFIAIM